MSDTSVALPSADVEKAGDYAHLTNTTVQTFGWENVSVTVNDRESKLPKTIVSNSNGIVKAGGYPSCTRCNISITDISKANCWLLWVPGNERAHLVFVHAETEYSGCGKTTLLNVLAHRVAQQSADVTKSMYINGSKTTIKTFQQLSVFVEQEDALMGALTVKETLYFAAKLSLSRQVQILRPLEHGAHLLV